MTFDFDGVPEIIAKVASKTDNETVKEKWEELRTLVHLVHKDEILRQRNNLTMENGMRSPQKNRNCNNRPGVLVRSSDFGVDYTYRWCKFRRLHNNNNAIDIRCNKTE